MMDAAKAFGAEFREVRNTEHNGEPARMVVGARTYATNLDDLWSALTDPERISRWFAPVSGDLEEGGLYQIEGNANGTITRCTPPEAFDVTWEFAGNTSYLSVRLAPYGDGARLTLEHTMLKDAANETHWNTYGPGATGVGWDLSFLGMGLFLDGDGNDIDRDVVNVWMTSERGKKLMRSCAIAWGEADITAGEDPGTARAKATKTAAFYCGE